MDFGSRPSGAPRPETPCQVESGTVVSHNATRPCPEHSRRSLGDVAAPTEVIDHVEKPIQEQRVVLINCNDVLPSITTTGGMVDVTSCSRRDMAKEDSRPHFPSNIRDQDCSRNIIDLQQ